MEGPRRKTLLRETFMQKHAIKRMFFRLLVAILVTAKPVPSTCPERPGQGGRIIRAVQEHRNAQKKVFIGPFVQLFEYCDLPHI
jgi:hypothetical protein